MPDREKVIKGLEWCMNEKHDCYREKGCPYENEGEDIGYKYALHRDALARLKAQEHEALDMPKPDSDIGCWYDITHNYTLEQVVSALKAQEPRVMAGAELTDAELIEEIRKAPIVLKPNVDAVPVVRCKDCMYFRPWRHDRGDDSRCEFWNAEIGAEDYCSQAIYLNNKMDSERRDDDANN